MSVMDLQEMEEDLTDYTYSRIAIQGHQSMCYRIVTCDLPLLSSSILIEDV
jgi:hypothetical protein